jgi:hypothetical protein
MPLANLSGMKRYLTVTTRNFQWHEGNKPLPSIFRDGDFADTEVRGDARVKRHVPSDRRSNYGISQPVCSTIRG